MQGAALRSIAGAGGGAEEAGRRCPVVVFSHGLGGWRNNYAIICSQLASQGYVVLSLEHADGTATGARLAAGRGWRYYKGMGGVAGQTGKTRHRIAELRTALRLLRAMDGGKRVPGLALSDGADASALLAGGLDFECLAAVGHSFGGATITALCAEDAAFKCAVALDPWWYALPLDSPALVGWRSRVPLLAVASHDWYTQTDARGELLCSSSRQAAIFEACQAPGGGGAVHLVLAGSTHNTFADIVPLWGHTLAPLFGSTGLTARLEPVLGVHLVVASVLAFLSTHLPLPPAQREAQTWRPALEACAVERLQLAADRSRTVTGLLAPVWCAAAALLAALLPSLSCRRAVPFPAMERWRPTYLAGGRGQQLTEKPVSSYCFVPTTAPPVPLHRLRPVKSAVNRASDWALNAALRRLARNRSYAALASSLRETTEEKCVRHDGYNDPYTRPSPFAAAPNGNGGGAAGTGTGTGGGEAANGSDSNGLRLRRLQEFGAGTAPEDVLTAQEVLELAMPSAFPSSPLARAPSSFGDEVAAAASPDGGSPRAWEQGAAAAERLRGSVGSHFRPGPIRGHEDGDDLAALLSERHVLALHVYPAQAAAAAGNGGAQ